MIDWLWSAYFVQDQDEITNAFRMQKDADGNLIQGVTKVVILYCKFCGNEALYERLNGMLLTQAPELEVYGIRHQASEGNACFGFLCLLIVVLFVTMIFFGDKILYALDWQIPNFLPKLQAQWKVQLFMCFLMGLYIVSMVTSGAFEIYIDG